jgi:uncharacterized protein
MQLAVIAKEPRPGAVKTRLHPPLSLDEAAELARASLADTLEAVRATPARRHVLVLDGATGPWLPPGFEVIPQRGNGLAERLAYAFEDCLPVGPTLLVGMDTPQITPVLLCAAASRLVGSRTAVFGPATDGGYWSLGLTTADAAIFDGVAMSTASTGVQQRERLIRRGFTVQCVEQLRDVDTFADARAVAEEVPDSRFSRCLRRLRCFDNVSISETSPQRRTSMMTAWCAPPSAG